MDNLNGNLGIAGPKIGSLNCNGLGNKSKRDKVLNWLKNKQEEIFFLQETHSTSELENDWKKLGGGYLF